jgi:hypothetical protein
MLWFFFLFIASLFSADYDCAIVGTSPVPLFEALYRHYSGERVLVLEAAQECGGAWKSIDICGIDHADMGCHDLASTPDLNNFLEEYAGCRMIPSQTNFYFSKGCFELIGNLLKRIKDAGISLFTGCRVQSVQLDQEKKVACLKTVKGTFTARKIVVTQGSSFEIDGIGRAGAPHKFYHLYLLLQDPTPNRFSSHPRSVAEVSRMMNLTPFLNLAETGRQLIVLQTPSEGALGKADSFVSELKRANLIDPGAYLLKAEPYVYEQGPPFPMSQLRENQKMFFEMLNTSHFNVIANYMPKWSKILPPYREGHP